MNQTLDGKPQNYCNNTCSLPQGSAAMYGNGYGYGGGMAGGMQGYGGGYGAMGGYGGGQGYAGGMADGYASGGGGYAARPAGPGRGGGGYGARPAGGMSGGEMGGGPRPRMDQSFVEGKLFLGGLDNTTSKETLLEYCGQWWAQAA